MSLGVLTLAAPLASSAAPLAPTVLLPAPETSGVALAGSLQRGWVAPFRSVERDQESVALTTHWSPSEAATLRLHYEVLTARWPDGTQAGGSGDIRLGAAGRAWDGGAAPAAPEIWIDWSAKLPNAPDESTENNETSDGLGTDETDISVGGVLRWALDPTPLTATLGASLLILGNPLMFANQDDIAQLTGLVTYAIGPVDPYTRVEARLPSPRNPADIAAVGGAEWRNEAGLRAGAEARVGLTPAASDWGAAAWFGYAWACPRCQYD